MVNVSKQTLQSHVKTRAVEDLLKVLAKHTRKGVPSPWEALISEPEAIQLAKRLAIIVMLYKNAPHYAIAHILKVSPSTVAKHDKKLQSGEYEAITKIISKPITAKAVYALLHKILTIMPPYVPTRKRGRWDAFKTNFTGP